MSFVIPEAPPSPEPQLTFFRFYERHRTVSDSEAGEQTRDGERQRDLQAFTGSGTAGDTGRPAGLLSGVKVWQFYKAQCRNNLSHRTFRR